MRTNVLQSLNLQPAHLRTESSYSIRNLKYSTPCHDAGNWVGWFHYAGMEDTTSSQHFPPTEILHNLRSFSSRLSMRKNGTSD